MEVQGKYKNKKPVVHVDLQTKKPARFIAFKNEMHYFVFTYARSSLSKCHTFKGLAMSPRVWLMLRQGRWGGV